MNQISDRTRLLSQRYRAAQELAIQAENFETELLLDGTVDETMRQLAGLAQIITKVLADSLFFQITVSEPKQ